MARKMTGNMVMQGDVMIHRINTIPNDAVKAETVNGQFIVTHSETGHNHVIEDDGGCMLLQDPNDELQGYLAVTGDEVELVHLREHHTHETIVIPEGNYVVRRQREYTPEGYRRAAD